MLRVKLSGKCTLSVQPLPHPIGALACPRQGSCSLVAPTRELVQITASGARSSGIPFIGNAPDELRVLPRRHEKCCATDDRLRLFSCRSAGSISNVMMIDPTRPRASLA